MADITWHSLGIDQGFLRIMANVNFHGSFSTAHPLGDAGGDMVSLLREISTISHYQKHGIIFIHTPMQLLGYLETFRNVIYHPPRDISNLYTIR